MDRESTPHPGRFAAKSNKSIRSSPSLELSMDAHRGAVRLFTNPVLDRNGMSHERGDSTMKRWLIAAAAVFAVGTAQAAEFKPAVVFDMGGKFDKSFNEGVYNGVDSSAARCR